MKERRRNIHALPDGYRLHWYEIDDILGQGGFGITYLAHDVNLNQRVAVKEFLPTDLAIRTETNTVEPFSDDQQQDYDWGLARFIREAQTLARFKHPNIVAVNAVFQENNTAYLVMEYVEGQIFEDAVRARQLKGEERMLEILHALLDGLELIHEAGFIHRDIKPDNIYLRSDGSPVLLDFGSARQASGGRQETMTALVSPGYAPYEQYDSSAELDKQGPWTDIYALGATFYRAVTGRGPVEAIIRMHSILEGNDRLEPAVEVGKGWFTHRYLSALDAALSFRPSDRPQSVAEWRAMLPPRPGEEEPGDDSGFDLLLIADEPEPEPDEEETVVLQAPLIEQAELEPATPKGGDDEQGTVILEAPLAEPPAPSGGPDDDEADEQATLIRDTPFLTGEPVSAPNEEETIIRDSPLIAQPPGPDPSEEETIIRDSPLIAQPPGPDPSEEETIIRDSPLVAQPPGPDPSEEETIIRDSPLVAQPPGSDPSEETIIRDTPLVPDRGANDSEIIIKPVEAEVSAKAGGTAPSSVEGVPQRRGGVSRLPQFFAIAVVAVVLGAALWWYWPQNQRALLPTQTLTVEQRNAIKRQRDRAEERLQEQEKLLQDKQQAVQQETQRKLAAEQATRLEEQKRLEDETLTQPLEQQDAARLAEQQRLEQEAAAKALAEQQAEQEAAAKALAEQQAEQEAARLAEQQRLEQEAAAKALAEQQAEQEAARLAEQQRLGQEAAAKALAEQQAEQEAARLAEQQRLGQEAAAKALAEQQAEQEAARLAEQQRLGQEAAAKALAEQQAEQEAERLAEQQRLEQEAVEASAAQASTATKVQVLLALADEDIAQFRLTSPAGNNAVSRLQQISEIEPSNVDVNARYEQIVGKYLELADKAAQTRQFDKAQGYLDKAETVYADHPGLEPAREELASLRKAQVVVPPAVNDEDVPTALARCEPRILSPRPTAFPGVLASIYGNPSFSGTPAPKVRWVEYRASSVINDKATEESVSRYTLVDMDGVSARVTKRHRTKFDNGAGTARFDEKANGEHVQVLGGLLSPVDDLHAVRETNISRGGVNQTMNTDTRTRTKITRVYDVSGQLFPLKIGNYFSYKGDRQTIGDNGEVTTQPHEGKPYVYHVDTVIPGSKVSSKLSCDVYVLDYTFERPDYRDTGKLYFSEELGLIAKQVGQSVVQLSDGRAVSRKYERVITNFKLVN